MIKIRSFSLSFLKLGHDSCVTTPS